MGKNNPLTSSSLKAADALKFTRKGLPCSRQWGREGGCSSAPQPCSQGLHLHVQLWHFHVSVRLSCRYLVQGAGFVPWPACCEAGSLVGGKQRVQHRPFVTYQLASDQELLLAALPADSNTLACIPLSRGYKHGAASPSSLQHCFIDLEWGYCPERRHPIVKFAVMAERGTRWSVPVTKGTNLNPLPSNAPDHVKSELGISRSAYHKLNFNEGHLLSLLKSFLCLQELQIKPVRRQLLCGH